MKLSGQDYKKLCASFCQAYTQKFDLKQMVRYGLEENLDVIVGGETITEIIFNLIDWVERQGISKVLQLLQYASEDRPDNEQLQETIKEILAKLDNSIDKRENDQSPLAPFGSRVFSFSKK